MTPVLGSETGAWAPVSDTRRDAGAGGGVPVVLESRPEGLPPGSAAAVLAATDLAGLRAAVDAATVAHVQRALDVARPTLLDFATLLSPVAAEHLEDMARRSREVTLRRFGRTVRLFAPLYLSNECVSTCTYCGFSSGNEVTRRTLSVPEVVDEAEELVRRGFRHLLLVAGEHARIVSKDYLVECVTALAPMVPSLSVEVQVWDGATYRRLVEAGCDGLVVYQEAYDRTTYGQVHLRGKKRNYDWRLSAPDRGAEAGMRRLGIGALLGLHPDWRSEALALAAHARALTKRWWRCELTVSVPRLRPAAGGFEPSDPVGDRELVQLLCALRLLLPDAGLVLSTREPSDFRDAVVPLGITHLSAGSQTDPGGYTDASGAEPQFDVADTRSPAEVAGMLAAAGYDAVWKDWQRA